MTADLQQHHFRSFEVEFERGGIPAALDRLAGILRQTGRYHELFEALKMQVRHRLGLPILYSDSGDELPLEQRDALEDGLLDSCREVGTLLFQEGKIREGWTYLRAVGEKHRVRQMLEQVVANDDNLDQIIEICLHESIDLEKGFRLVLSHYGTCNAITTFESAMYGRPRAQRAVGAKLLVEHVYHELSHNVASHIARVEGCTPPLHIQLRSLLSEREWLTAEGGYHIDATHLASTVRIARDLSDEASLEKAIELSQYGTRLDKSLQYAGDGPFTDLYPSHLLYFNALLERDVESGVEYFRQKAEASDPHEETTYAIEVYIDLLHRIGRTRDAIAALLKMIPEGMRTTGYGPSLLELCASIGDYRAAERLCAEKNDLLGFAMAKLKAGMPVGSSDV
jgi:hypothetical protein